jgi:hypothetical protein
MIIESARIIGKDDAPAASWAGIGRYRNVNFVADEICRLHSVSKKHRPNAIKQAEQLRYCLIQADEYFKAARSVTAATRPLLLYYGAMSFALAEILLKHTGVASLDNARGQHAHHGMDLKLDGNPSKCSDPNESARCLRAAPMMKSDGARYGTFELWHESSREMPIIGERTVSFPDHTSQISNEVVATPRNARMSLLPRQGISLLHCFKYTSGLGRSLREYGIATELVRGVHRHSVDRTTNNWDITLIIHPHRQDILDLMYEKFTFSPMDYEITTVIELERGCIIQQKFGPNMPHHGGSFPNSFQISVDEVLFCADNEVLNEFGIYYVGLFILGNYARYYPDMWMIDVETSSPLYLLATEFMNCAEARIPLLTFSELSRVSTVLQQ